MKTIIPYLIFIVISFISWNLYLELFKRIKGRKSSVSATAKYIPTWLFFTFIAFSLLPLMYLGQNYWTTFGIMVISGIGVITGINPNLLERNLIFGMTNETGDKWSPIEIQNFLHIILTNLGIALYMVGLIFIDWRLLIIIVPVLIICLILWIKQVKHHTWKIERILHYACCLCLLIERIILLIIN